MEPFSIACTTCQARLRVRDESVIGQILTCPKCGSMVLVEPVAAATDTTPSAATAESAGSATAYETAPSQNVSATPADFEDAASLFDEPSQQPASDSPDLTETVEDLSVQVESRQAADESAVDVEVVSVWTAESTEIGDPGDVAASQLSPPPRPVSDEVLLPDAAWTSASTVRWRNHLLMGIAAVVGFALASMLLIAFSGGDQETTIGARNTTPEMASTGEAVPRGPEPRGVADLATVTSADSDPEASSSEHGSGDDSPGVILPEAAEDDSSELPIELPIEAPASDSPRPDVLPGGEPATNDPRTDEPPGLTPKDTTTESAATAGGEPGPLSETLREFGAFLGRTEAAVSPMPAVPSELPPAMESAESEAEPISRRTGPRVVEVAERLSDPVLGFEFDGGPLASFLQLVSDYSTIPISLDADSLRWVKVSPSTAVKLKSSETTVAEILQDGLAPLGLEYRIESDQLFVTQRPKNETGIRTVTFEVGDLVGDDAGQLQQLGTHIMDFAAPETWSSRGGIGTITFRGTELIIEQHDPVQFEILEFCEKLRVARGLKTRYSTYDPSLFRLATRSERAQAKLAQSITLTYIRPARLQRIVDRIAQAAKLHILIDWRTLAEAGWSPDAEVRFSVADQPVARALAALLEPMDLAYRVIDESTLQVTTPSVVESRLEVEFYRVAKLDDDGAKLVQSARGALGPANFRDFGGGGQLVFDQPSKCLMACLSQARQIELQAWLSARPDAAKEAAAVATPAATVGSRIFPTSGRASND